MVPQVDCQRWKQEWKCWQKTLSRWKISIKASAILGLVSWMSVNQTCKLGCCFPTKQYLLHHWSFYMDVLSVSTAQCRSMRWLNSLSKLSIAWLRTCPYLVVHGHNTSFLSSLSWLLCCNYWINQWKLGTIGHCPITGQETSHTLTPKSARLQSASICWREMNLSFYKVIVWLCSWSCWIYLRQAPWRSS